MPAFSVTRRGPRHERNMDFLGVDDARGLYVVSDGIGTRRPSDIASRAAVEACMASLAEVPASPSGWRPALARAVQRANAAVHEAAKTPAAKGVSATLTVLLRRGDDYAVAHAGDSRCCLLDAGGLRQLTDDHNVAFELYKAGALSAEKLREHPDRHLLTRSLGGDFVVPDIIVARAPGARFLLCTDGLVKVLDEMEIAAILSRASGQAACDALADAAAARGAGDDVTIVLVEP